MKKIRKPLREVKNFGPVCACEFESMGFIYWDQLEKMSFEEICRLWVQYFPSRLNANAFLGVICSLEGIVWTNATPEHRAIAHSLVKIMRHEYGLPRVKRQKVNKRK